MSLWCNPIPISENISEAFVHSKFSNGGNNDVILVFPAVLLDFVKNFALRMIQKDLLFKTDGAMKTCFVINQL